MQAQKKRPVLRVRGGALRKWGGIWVRKYDTPGISLAKYQKALNDVLNNPANVDLGNAYNKAHAQFHRDTWELNPALRKFAKYTLIPGALMAGSFYAGYYRR